MTFILLKFNYLDRNEETLFIYCKTAESKKQLSRVEISSNSKNNHAPLVIQEKREYLSESMIINGKYFFSGKIEAIEDFIKKPDSIRIIEDDCTSIFEDGYEIWYYKNCEIEISNTQYSFAKINFVFSNFTLTYKDIVFSEKYMLKDFKNHFPLSFLTKSEEKNGTTTINMLVAPQADDMYRFKFKNNKLIELHYFFLC